MKTDVIFRKENGITLAVFPYEIHNKYSTPCYAHVGQHSGCDYDYILKYTKPTDDYKDLYDELISIGYDLNVIKRRNYDKYLKSYYKQFKKSLCM